MPICGIDPGKHGGIAEIWQTGNPAKTHISCDIMRDPSFLWKHFTSLKAAVIEAPEPFFIYLEKAQAMPGNGIVSMFNYGVHFGHIEGMLIGLQIPYELVPAHVWAKEMHAGASGSRPKERSKSVVSRLFPDVNLKNPDNPKSRILHEGIVDALLIAEYGRRKRSLV